MPDHLSLPDMTTRGDATHVCGMPFQSCVPYAWFDGSLGREIENRKPYTPISISKLVTPPRLYGDRLSRLDSFGSDRFT